ncbi:MAG: hypothetical protein ACOYLQ_06070 [Hyphomicrobiaceae bacterium]|jgi:hypothetical protein
MTRRISTEPLTPEECARLWRWERRMVIFYAAAMVLMGIAALLATMFADQSWSLVLMIALIGALMIAGAYVQFRDHCPRCGLNLGRQGGVLLPLNCKACRVVFPRRRHTPATTES